MAVTPALKKHKQIDLYEFKASMLGKGNSNPTRATQRTSMPKEGDRGKRRNEEKEEEIKGRILT